MIFQLIFDQCLQNNRGLTNYNERSTVQLVKIINGRHSIGKKDFRPVQDVVFPLVDATIHKGAKGNYIMVNGEVVKGFPKRDFKMYVNTRGSFKVLSEDDAKLWSEKGPEGLSKVKAVKLSPSKEDGVLEPESLHGDDDDLIKSRIDDRFHYLRRACLDAADGEITGIVVSGPPGVGKSFEVEETLEHGDDNLVDVMEALTRNSSDAIDPDTPVVKPPKRKEKIRYTVIGGHMAPMALYKTLYDYRQKRSVVVLDDCDVVLFNEQCLNLLKRALDTGAKKRVINWGSERIEHSGYEQSFIFEGSVIFISNLDFENPPRGSASIKEHLEAIMDRSYYIDLTMKTMRDKFLRIEQVCKDKGVLQKMGLEPEQVDEVMTFFEANIENFRYVSIRTVQKVAKQYLLNPTDWQTSARIYTFKTDKQ